MAVLRPTLAALVVLGAAEVRAQADRLEPLIDDRGWPAGTIQEQLDTDPTLVPFGKGAIFVPALTNPLDEPPVTVFAADQLVAEGTTGQRIVVLPGTYNVRIGSGAVKERQTIQTTVREMHTSVVPVTWAGLAVHIVDTRLNSLRGSYEIIRVEDREYMGIGFGADEQQGEPVTTWILRPGLYKIVRVGETYRARRDFATVRLQESHLSHFLLVIDEETGDFEGGGEVPEEDLFLAQSGRFFWSFIFGGDFTMNHRKDVVGADDGLNFAIRAFIDAKISARIFGSPLILQLQIEEGQTKAPGDRPFQKTQDRADVDGLYVYKWVPWLGPYVRFGAETNLVEGVEFFETPTNVDILNVDGSVRRNEFQQETQLLSPPFGLTQIKEGIGLNARLFKAIWAETTLRAGVGARHRITNRLLELNDDPATTDAVEYQFVESNNRVGVEATWLAVGRLTRWVLLNVEVDALLPFFDDALDPDEGGSLVQQTVLEIEATLALKLTSFMSVNYVFRYLRDPSLSDTDSIEQDVLLRFSLELP